MTDKRFKLAAGGLLHDVGKLLYRYNDQRNHSTSGCDLIKQYITDKDILDCVQYHHGNMLKNSDVADNALCYITYIADNIAAFSDRRKSENGEGGFVRNISYQTVFNILNGNNEKKLYKSSMLNTDEVIYPQDNETAYTDDFYGKAVDIIKNSLAGIEYTSDYINSLSEIFEAATSYIPSSTQTNELRDISLYDHVKLTAAFSLCIFDYLCENNITDYKDALFKNSDKFYDKPVFLIYSADISGIQNFIYNISSKNALKSLRSRSFYLELIMETAVDTLLDRLSLTKCNVMYSGGGHTYLILPNTQNTKETIKTFENDLNKWFIDNYGTEIYIGGGYAACSANDLKNKTDGSYSRIFREISQNISEKKMKRYSALDIRKLNSHKSDDNERECVICKRSDKLTEVNGKCICELCAGLLKLSDSIIDPNKKCFYTILDCKPDQKTAVSLPFDLFLTVNSADELKENMKNNEHYVRSYSKNSMNTGKRLSSRIWVGDYCSAKEFAIMAENSCGIKRIAVLRADIDNLGQTFVHGFDDKYNTISRTSELSAKLSLFFKYNINSIMKKPVFRLNENAEGGRNAAIIYSGGDDVFIVGGWDDVIGAAIDLNNALRKFSCGALTISAGIGIYTPTYPLYSMAQNSGRLEDISKGNAGKNSVTLFDENHCYHWDELCNKVIGEKYALLREFISNNEKGKSLLYKILELIRCRKESNKLNIARFAYLLGRLAPDNNAPEEKVQKYNNFSNVMYSWIQNDEDAKQLITAIYLYVYMIREENNENE